MNMIKAIITSLCFCLFSIASKAQLPQIGAEVWIEPGQTYNQIDNYFRLMSEYKMTTARIFIMWNQIETQPGVYDYTVYDMAFKAAERYNIKIVATLTAAEPAPCRNKRSFYFLHTHLMPEDESELPIAIKYITETVNRYKNSPVLEYWWLTNEPGQSSVPSKLAVSEFRKWVMKKYNSIDVLNQKWLTYFKNFDEIEYAQGWDKGQGWSNPIVYYDWHAFWIDFQTWYLRWVATEIKKVDTKHPLTVNPHTLYDNLHRYNFEEWRSFIDILGASIHPSWALPDFARDRFAFGMAGCCDLIKGKTNKNEFWVSELQAGPNTLGGWSPLCPDSLDIAQWVWTSIGCNAKRILYWSLNSRPTGGEAGEWSIFGYGLTPSDRVNTSKKISETLIANKQLFSNAKQIPAKITIITTPESQFMVDRKGDGYAARNTKSVFKSYMAWHMMFMRMGLTVEIREAKDYEWESAETGRIAIFANVMAIPVNLEKKIYKFVENGNKIIADGFSFQFDEKENFLPLDVSPYEKLLGAKLTDVKLQIDPKVTIHFNNPAVDLPANMFKAELIPTTATVLSGTNKIAYATRNKFGKGEVVYIPQVIGVDEFDKHSVAFAKLTYNEVKSIYDNYPVVLENMNEEILLQTLVSEDKYISVVTNCTTKEVKTNIKCKSKKATVIWGDEASLNNNSIRLRDRETLVILWE